MILRFLFRIRLPNTSQWARPVTRRQPVSKALSTNPQLSRGPSQASRRHRNRRRELAARLRPQLRNSRPTPRPQHQLRHQHRRPRNRQNPQRRRSRPSLRAKLPKRPNPPRRKESRSHRSRKLRSPGTTMIQKTTAPMICHAALRASVIPATPLMASPAPTVKLQV